MKPAIRTFAEDRRRKLADHPSPDELVDYHAGDLKPAERERIQDHLALCPACARAVLDLDVFPDVETLRPEERLSDIEMRAEWDRFRRRAAPPAPLWLALEPAALRYGLAAGLLLSVLGTGFLIGRSWVAGPAAGPQGNEQLVALFQQGSQRGGDEPVKVQPWAESFILLFDFPDAALDAEYTAAITTEGGHEIWRQSGLHPTPEGALPLVVARKSLPPGTYHLYLYGPDLRQPPVAEYALRLQR